MFYAAGGKAADASVKEAVVSEKRISIDWLEDGNLGHLEAVSHDGTNFRGHYGYPTITNDFVVELKRYAADGEVLFFGTWYERDIGEQGIWAFVLEEFQREE